MRGVNCVRECRDSRTAISSCQILSRLLGTALDEVELTPLFAFAVRGGDCSLRCSDARVGGVSGRLIHRAI